MFAKPCRHCAQLWALGGLRHLPEHDRRPASPFDAESKSPRDTSCNPSDMKATNESAPLRTLSSFALLVGLVLWSPMGLASPPPAGVAPVLQPTGGFSIDGDLIANTPAGGVGDWMTNSISGTGGGVLNSAGLPLNPSVTFHFVDPYSSGSDLVFSGGMKWTDDPNLWRWTTGKPSSKTDINNVLLHLTTDAMGHTWVVIAADRFSTSGDSYIDFEFLQNTLTRTNNGLFVSTGPDGGRTTGDLLLSLAFGG